MNKVMLVGNLGSEVELKYVGNQNRAVANFRLATNEVYKDSSGVRQQRTEWHRITVWGAKAENCAKYLSVGSKNVVIEGKIRYGSYTDGEGIKRYTVSIEAYNVEFGSRPNTVGESVGEELSEDEQSDIPI